MYRLTFLILIFANFSWSQQWCEPGANWKYNYINLSWEGYSEITYVRDTIINSEPCHVLERQLVITDLVFPGGGLTYLQSQDIFTYENLGLVYILNEGVWDTLYNFNSAIGDSWQMPQDNWAGICDSNSFIEVLDTGHLLINGLNLKFLTVDFHFDGNLFTSPIRDTIVERIGFINNYMLPKDQCFASLDGHIGGEFRCYSDSVISYQNPLWTDSCTFVSASLKNGEFANVELKIWPNPTNSSLNISGFKDGDEVQYKIWSLQGKLVKNGIMEKDKIIVENLCKGVYLVELKSRSKVFRKRIIKQ